MAPSFLIYDTMKVINEQLLNDITEKARQSPRLRMNYNFHDQLDDPLNRLVNAMEPGTYLRPHRHLNPDKDESFLILRGSIALFTFDDEGTITEHLVLDPKAGVYGADIKAGVWHGLIVLEPDTVLYEAKHGPFAPLSPENFAPWSPEPENTEEVKEYIRLLSESLPPCCYCK
jgi:cupin fold WbuC family metalloprotein